MIARSAHEKSEHQREAAAMPAGSNEQHLEHLPMEFDMAAATHDIDLPEMIAYTNCEPNSYF